MRVAVILKNTFRLQSLCYILLMLYYVLIVKKGYISSVIFLYISILIGYSAVFLLLSKLFYRKNRFMKIIIYFFLISNLVLLIFDNITVIDSGFIILNIFNLVLFTKYNLSVRS